LRVLRNSTRLNSGGLIMAYRKFLTSVADVYAYDANDNIVFVSKTLLDSSIEVTLGSTPVRGGQGNQLQYTYYHTAEMNFTLTDTQWNLGMLGSTVGADFTPGEYYKEENVAVVSGSGTVSETPLAFEGQTIYGWATSPLGATQKITISEAGAFNVLGEEAGGNWCVRYYTKNTTEGLSFTIAGNFMPSIVKLVMECQLNSADATTNKIGMVQIIAPRVILSGAFSISMSADGISNTPLTGTALAYIPTGSDSADACESGTGYYAKVVEIIDNTNWWDNVYAISVYGGDLSLAVGETSLLTIYALSTAGLSFRAPNSDITFVSSASPKVTVGSSTGLVTGVSAGSAIITATVTSASAIDTTVDVVVA